MYDSWGEYLRLQATGLAKETLGDFAIYTFVNTIPYELINSLAYAVGDTILTSNTNNKRSSGSTKKSVIVKIVVSKILIFYWLYIHLGCRTLLRAESSCQ